MRRLPALLMAALLLLYLVFTIQYAVRLIADPLPLAKAIGVALLVLPLIGVWALVAELVFAVRAERLAERLGRAGRLPVDDLSKRPSGRPDRAEADRQFPEYRAAVEAFPDDWGTWFRLGLAYDASGDRRRARWATRRAIALSRAHPSASDSAPDSAPSED
jgi:cytochrome c-type biogenesis protein CcmH/NrfG